MCTCIVYTYVVLSFLLLLLMLLFALDSELLATAMQVATIKIVINSLLRHLSVAYLVLYYFFFFFPHHHFSLASECAALNIASEGTQWWSYERTCPRTHTYKQTPREIAWTIRTKYMLYRNNKFQQFIVFFFVLLFVISCVWALCDVATVSGVLLLPLKVHMDNALLF